eukprot:scaffold20339_cov128-Cylindrotheca_fusiformis.AAC.15
MLPCHHARGSVSPAAQTNPAIALSTLSTPSLLLTATLGLQLAPHSFMLKHGALLGFEIGETFTVISISSMLLPIAVFWGDRGSGPIQQQLLLCNIALRASWTYLPPKMLGMVFDIRVRIRIKRAIAALLLVGTTSKEHHPDRKRSSSSTVWSSWAKKATKVETFRHTPLLSA